MRITNHKIKITFIETWQMIEVDRLMVENYNIKLIQMMENAGRNLAEFAMDYFSSSLKINKTIMILAGTGGNAGGALVCARHLHNRGMDVIICLTKNLLERDSVTAHQLKILEKLNVKIIAPNLLSEYKNISLIIDGIIGYSLMGKPNAVVESMINWANKYNCKILSLDGPTGLSTTTGEIFSVAIQADVTLTLALPKIGFLNPTAKMYLGELFLADISVPNELYKEESLNLSVGKIFSESSIIKINI